MARSLTEEGLALDRERGDKWAIAWSLWSLAGLLSQQGEYTRARALLEESLALFRALRDAMGISDSLLWLGWVLFLTQGDSATVRSLLEEGLVLIKELGDKEGIAFYCYVSGKVALSQGDAAAARLLAEESVVLYKEMGYRQGTSRSLSALAGVAAIQGDQLTARVLYEESLAVARGIGDKWAIASCFEGLASVVAAQGELVWAARLWEAAEALREAVSAPLAPVDRANYEQSIITARTQVGEKVFVAVWTEGRMMSPEQVLGAKGKAMEPTAMPARPESALPMKSPTFPAGLTVRELEVLRLLATGLTDAQIAEQLVLSLHTIHAHLRTIYSKLGVTSRSAATRYAFEHQLV